MVVTVSKDISSCVLTVGPQYKNHRGGIGGVIDTYSKYFEDFNYIRTYGTSKKGWTHFVIFIRAIFSLFTCLISNKRIKIVHIHGAAKGSVLRKYIIFIISKKIFRKKVIFHCHASEMEKFYMEASAPVKKLCNVFFNNVDLIIALSKSWEVFFKTNFKPKSILILENIVEKPANVKRELRSELPVIFLFLGAIGKRKGIFDLLEVINTHKATFGGRMKLIVGGNGEIERFKQYIETNDLLDIVEFKGWVSGEEKNKLLANSDIYILPSYNEGLPLSILEAMTYGKAIISTTVGGISEIVEDYKNGVLTSPGNLDEIYNAIQVFLKSPRLTASYGEISIKKVEPYYAEHVIPHISEIYQTLLSN